MNEKAIEAYDAICVAMEKLRDLDEADARSVATSLDGWASGRLGPMYKAVSQELIPFLSRPRVTSRTLTLESLRRENFAHTLTMTTPRPKQAD